MSKQESLEKELAFFDKHKAEYCKNFAGKFVLIHGEEFLGAFPTDEQAYAAGLQKVGNVAFLIKRAVPDDPDISIPAYTFGLLGG